MITKEELERFEENNFKLNEFKSYGSCTDFSFLFESEEIYFQLLPYDEANKDLYLSFGHVKTEKMLKKASELCRKIKKYLEDESPHRLFFVTGYTLNLGIDVILNEEKYDERCSMEYIQKIKETILNFHKESLTAKEKEKDYAFEKINIFGIGNDMYILGILLEECQIARFTRDKDGKIIYTFNCEQIGYLESMGDKIRSLGYRLNFFYVHIKDKYTLKGRNI